MDIKKGDKVKFLNESGGGVVVQIIDGRQALVQIEDGFEIPVLISHLVKTESSGTIASIPEQPKKAFKPTDNPKMEIPQVSLKKQEPTRIKESTNLLLAIVPKKEKLNAENAVFDIYLLNDGNFYFYYTVALEKQNNLQLIEKGELEREMKVHIGTYSYNSLIKLDAIVIQYLIYSQEEYKLHLPGNFRFNMKGSNLLSLVNYTENDFFYENAYIVDATGKNEENVSILKKNFESKLNLEEIPAKKPVSKTNNEIEEVDLHIEEIVDDISTMSATDILNTQMARFTTSLEGAIKAKARKIVFIHGVGNGKLKYELRKTLDTKYSFLHYQDASFAEYGYGATMVIIK